MMVRGMEEKYRPFWRVRLGALAYGSNGKGRHGAIHGLFHGLGPWQVDEEMLATVCVNPSFTCLVITELWLFLYSHFSGVLHMIQWLGCHGS